MFDIHFDGTEVGYAVQRLYKAIGGNPDAEQAIVDLAGTEEENININALFDTVMIYDQQTFTVVVGIRPTDALCRIVTTFGLVINPPGQETPPS